MAARTVQIPLPAAVSQTPSPGFASVASMLEFTLMTMPGAGVGVGVGVGGGKVGLYSYAPISQVAAPLLSPSSGRVVPRWSCGGHAWFSAWSIAGLALESAWVSVLPPL